MEKQSKDKLDDKMGNMSNKREEIDQSLQTTDLLQLIHEMKEKQLELEKQNQQLMQIHAETAEVYRQYTDLYDFAPVGYFTLARDGSVLRANLPGADLLSAEYEKLTKQTLGAFISDESLPVFYNFYEQLLSSTGRQACELKLLNNEKWVRIESTCFEGGEECRAVVVDISERKRISALLHARLRISEAADTYNLDDLLQKALDEAEALTGSQIGFAHFLQEDQKTLHLQMWSSNTLNHMCTAEGKGSHYPVEEAGVWAECVYTRKPVIHNDYASLPHRKGLPEGHAPVQRELVVPILRNDLIVMIMGVGNKAEYYEENDLHALEQLASLTWDIIQRKKAEDALKVSARKYRLLHETMIDGFASVDMNGKFLDCNDSYMNMLGYSREELTQLTYSELTPEKWHAAEADIVENQIIKRGYSDVYEKEYIRKDGTIFPVELRTVLLRDEAGNPKGMWAVIRDITERKYDERALETANIELQTALLREQQLARTDPLTGVHNRRYLYELAEHELQVATRYERPLSVIMFDIDHFKIVNDTFGHKTGDRMLTLVIDTACAELRSADVIGRYGGEEFIILLPMTTVQQASQVAERIRSNVSALRIPTPKGKATVTLSIGVIELKHAASKETVEDMFRRTDEAMYTAKQAGRNRVELG